MFAFELPAAQRQRTVAEGGARDPGWRTVAGSRHVRDVSSVQVHDKCVGVVT